MYVQVCHNLAHPTVGIHGGGHYCIGEDEVLPHVIVARANKTKKVSKTSCSCNVFPAWSILPQFSLLCLLQDISSLPYTQEEAAMYGD